MSKLDVIRERLNTIAMRFQDDRIQNGGTVPSGWYRRDVALLLAVADAALAYEESTQIPGGAQQAEQDMFSTLAPLKEAV